MRLHHTLALLASVLASPPAAAALLRADFTGTIYNSSDYALPGQSVGMLFGSARYLGQKTINGSIYFDDSVYTDSNLSANIGRYGGTQNAFRSVITIDGKTFDSNWFQRTGAAYNSEDAVIYDNAFGHDYFGFSEQAAYKPITYQGAFGQMVVSLSLVDYLSPANSFTNFLNGTTLDQAINLGAADMAKLEIRSGTYTLQLYCGWQDDFGFAAGGLCPEGVYTYPSGYTVDYHVAPWGTNASGSAPASGDIRAVMTDARGDFTLDSFRLQRVQTQPPGHVNTVPEPGSYALLGLGLLGLAIMRRQQAQRFSAGRATP